MSHNVIDLTSDEADCIRELSNAERDALLARLQRARSTKSAPASFGTKINSRGVAVRVGLCVELDDHEFFYVRKITRTYPMTMEGNLLRRVRKIKNLLPKQRNEVAIVFQAAHGSSDPKAHECLTSLDIDRAVAERQVIFTNRPSSKTSYHGRNRANPRGVATAEHERLVCRQKYIEYFQMSAGKVKIVFETMTEISEEECSPGAGMPDIVRKRKNGPHIDVDLTADDNGGEPISALAPRQIHLYPYGDVGAGGGGMASGAKQAGLQISWLLDIDKDACKTLKYNFPGARIFCNDLFDLAVGNIQAPVVVVLHFSPPCQPHSSAHTRDGKDDEKNIAACFALGELLKRLKPRILTFEETSCMLTHNNRIYLNALLHSITSNGYNWRMGVLNCAQYGNVQPRKRLFIVGSCPGEPLPPFPTPTHGLGLKPPVTIARVLSKISNRAIPAHMRAFTPKPYAARYEANQQLRNCITTSGGASDLHPDGGRSFNLQELACLAGFLLSHVFPFFKNTGQLTRIRKLIGNAVPSLVAKLVLKEVIKTLQETDRKRAELRARVINLD